MDDNDKIVAAILAAHQCQKLGIGGADGHVRRYREMLATLAQYEDQPLPAGKAKIGAEADET